VSVSSTIWVPDRPIIPGNALCLCTQTFPIWVDMTVYRGDSGHFWCSVHECLDFDQQLNLNNATWDADIRHTFDDTDPIVTMDVIPVWNSWPFQALVGTVEVVLTAANSEKLHTDAVWDLQMNLNGHVTTLVAGNVFVTKDVSRT
jgi:hypothetical protein